MKKVMLTLLVIALAVPTFAADIAIVDNGDQTATIVYSAAAGEAVRGIALEVTITGGSLAGDATGINPEFNVFPDSAWAAVDGGGSYTIGTGTPLATTGAKGPLATAAGATSFSICMGMLDQTGNQAAATSGTDIALLTLPLTCDGTAPITIAIAEDTLRGGIVGDAVVPGTIAGGEVACGGPSICKGDVVGQYGVGGPNGTVDVFDLTAIVTYISGSADTVFYTMPADGQWAPADVVGQYGVGGPNGSVDVFDLTAIVTYISGSADTVFYSMPCMP